jgi:hypothetical protein
MNGRALSSLVPLQQFSALSIGLSVIPDATNSFIVQNNVEPIGSISGSNTITLLQSNLPNVTPTITIQSNGAHTHTYTYRGAGAFGTASGTESREDDGQFTGTTSSSGAHTHTATSTSINPNTQTSIDIRPRQLAANAFLYLGVSA